MSDIVKCIRNYCDNVIEDECPDEALGLLLHSASNIQRLESENKELKIEIGFLTKKPESIKRLEEALGLAKSEIGSSIDELSSNNVNANINRVMVFLEEALKKIEELEKDNR